MPVTAPTPTVRALLRRLVDYAGLFPPAALSMAEAAARYAAHLHSRDGWMLGRFVVPLERLDELAAAAAPHFAGESEPWRLSALIGADVASAGPVIREFNGAHRGRFVVDVVECRPLPAGSVARAVGALPGELRSFVELSLLDDPRAMLEEINAAGAWAKARTGGVTAEAFPTARQLARVILRAAEVRVPFKATAGLHHPVTGEYPLTYAADSPRAPMFGFLNLFAAAVFAQRHATDPMLVSEARLAELLQEQDADAIVMDDECIRWRGLSAGVKQIAGTRTSLGISFGSCSFAEPVEGLRAMRLL
jgi:hypothetical protein